MAIYSKNKTNGNTLKWEVRIADDNKVRSYELEQAKKSIASHMRMTSNTSVPLKIVLK